MDGSRKTMIHTDHEPQQVTCITSQARRNHRQVRWLEYLARIDNTIVYVRGDKNAVAHALSRMLTTPSEPVTSLRADDWSVMSKDKPKTKRPTSFEI